MFAETRRWGIASWAIGFALLSSGLSFLCLTPGCGKPTVAESAVAQDPASPQRQPVASEAKRSDIRENGSASATVVTADRLPVVARKPIARQNANSIHPPQNEMLRRLAARLHNEALAHFYSDPSNGFSRLPLVYERIVRKWKSPAFSPGELGSDEPIAFETDLLKIHRSSLNDFSTRKAPTTKSPAPRFGRTANIHGKKFDRNRKVWEVNRLDLVGLVMHAEPVAYVSEKLPEMDKLHAVPTRKLDDFEYSGISVLQAGKNLYARTDHDTIRLMGAVRATKNCLACHKSNKTGDLLGAFSYTLREAKYKRSVRRFHRRLPVQSAKPAK